MGDSNKLLLIAGGALAAYMLVKKKDTQEPATPGGGGSYFNLGGFDLSGLLGNIPSPQTVIPEINLPGGQFIPDGFKLIPENLNPFPEYLNPFGDFSPEDYFKDMLNQYKDKLTGAADDAFKNFNKTLTGLIPPELLTPPDKPPIPELPGQPGKDDDTDSTNRYAWLGHLQSATQQAGGLYGRQLLAVAGGAPAVVRPLLGRSQVKLGGQIARKVTPPLAEKLALRLGARGGAKALGKAASYFIPFVGWASFAADVGADLARLFGADVTEWLGFTPIISDVGNIFTQGEGNWLENVVSEAGQQNILHPEQALAASDAAIGMPEQPRFPEYNYKEVNAANFKVRGYTQGGAPIVSTRPVEEYSPAEWWR